MSVNKRFVYYQCDQKYTREAPFILIQGNLQQKIRESEII